MEFMKGEDLILASDTIDSIGVLLDPATATEWLETQVRNRDPLRRAVVSYRADMANGRWGFDAAPLRFDREGHLIDGQNRLTALAGIPDPDLRIKFLVVRGLEPETQLIMDLGARRSAAQQLGLHDIPHASAMAAGARLCLNWQRDLLFAREGGGLTNVVTPNTVLDWVLDPENEVLIRAVATRLSMMRAIGLRLSVGVGFSFYLGKRNLEDTGALIEEMYNLANLAPTSPTLVYAKRLARVRNDPDLRLSEHDQLGFLVQTWNAWKTGAASNKLQRPTNGWAKSFPKVVGL